MPKNAISIVVLLAVGAAAFGAWQQGLDIAAMQSFVQEQGAFGQVAYIGAFIVSTILPVSALPLLPLAARSYGVATTVVLTASGWWIGSLIAFAIARRARGLFARFVSKRAVERLDARLPTDVGFSGIFVLRVAFPGDIVGFALGLLERVRFPTYAAASLAGTIPGAIVLSYAGGELGKGHFTSAAILMGALTLSALFLKRLLPAKARTQE